MWLISLSQHLTRMLIESDDHRGQTGSLGLLPDLTNEKLVTTMNTVKESYRRHTGWKNRIDSVFKSDDIHL